MRLPYVDCAQACKHELMGSTTQHASPCNDTCVNKESFCSVKSVQLQLTVQLEDYDLMHSSFRSYVMFPALQQSVLNAAVGKNISN